MGSVDELVSGGGPAIPERWRGRGDSGTGRLEDYAESLCSFLQEHEWLFECHITEFFVYSLWRAPPEHVRSRARP